MYSNIYNILYRQPTQHSLLIQLFPLMNICDDNQEVDTTMKISGDEIPPSCCTEDRSICMPQGLWRPCPSVCTPRDDPKHRFHNHIQLHGLIEENDERVDCTEDVLLSSK
jgi:hypothetical protein